MEPINIFSRFADPAKVARGLRELADRVDFDGDDATWRHATVSFVVDGAAKKLTISHDPEYYSEPNWSAQMSGMQGYFNRFPES